MEKKDPHQSVEATDIKDVLVSVVTATYNRAQYLPYTIKSVLNQTHHNIEYHIVDDGSTDDTAQVVKPYLEDKRLFYYVQENKGQSVARNVGLKHSQGQFICFIDSDNLWTPDKVESQLKVICEKLDVDIVYGDGECIDEIGKVIETPVIRRHSGFITEQLLRNNCVSFNTAMFRRKCYVEMGGLDESLRRSDDYDFWLRYSTKFKFLYNPGNIAQYRVWPNQLSSNKEARFAANQVIISHLFERFPLYARKEIQSATWSNFYVNRGRSRALNSWYLSALCDYLKALTYTPWSVGPWRAMLRLFILWK